MNIKHVSTPTLFSWFALQVLNHSASSQSISQSVNQSVHRSVSHVQLVSLSVTLTVYYIRLTTSQASQSINHSEQIHSTGTKPVTFLTLVHNFVKIVESYTKMNLTHAGSPDFRLVDFNNKVKLQYCLFDYLCHFWFILYNNNTYFLYHRSVYCLSKSVSLSIACRKSRAYK